MKTPLLEIEKQIYDLAKLEDKKIPHKKDVQKLLFNEKKALKYLQGYNQTTAFEPPKDHFDIVLSAIQNHIAFLEEFLTVISEIYGHELKTKPKKAIYKYAIYTRFENLKEKHNIESKTSRYETIQEELSEFLSQHIELETIRSYLKPQAIETEKHACEFISKNFEKLQFFYYALHRLT